MHDLPTITKGYTRCHLGQLHFLRAGTATAKPPLVLLHQNPSTSEEYRALIAAMATDRQVIAFDTPGYGMSDGPGAPLDMTGYAEAFADGLGALGMGAAVDLFGFHTGAFLAVELGRVLGTRCGRIALAGIPFRPADERVARLAQIRAVGPPTEDGAAILERLRWLWDFVVTQRHPSVPVERAATMFVERAKPLHRYWWAYDAVWRYQAEARLGAIAQPVLVLLPDEMLRAHSIAAARLMPDATLVDLPMLGRDIFEPEGGCAQLADALRTFLS